MGICKVLRAVRAGGGGSRPQDLFRVTGELIIQTRAPEGERGSVYNYTQHDPGRSQAHEATWSSQL